MRRIWFFLLLLLLLLLPARTRMHAQTFDLEKDRQPVASLDGLWRFHTGDNAQWADPNFDDTQWPLLRSNEDWGRQGYDGYSGMAWYRFKIQVPEGNKPLTLLLPNMFTGYQIFADGRQIGGCGEMPPHPVARYCIPATIALPTGSSPNRHVISIAIRVWHWSSWASYFGGGPYGSSYIGTPTLIQHHLQAVFDRNFKHLVQYYFLAMLASLGALVSFALFLFRRSDREYLWFGCMLLLESLEAALHVHDRIYPVRIVSSAVLEQLLVSIDWFVAIALYYVLLRGRRSWLFYAAVAGASLFLLQALSYSSGIVQNRFNVGIFNVIATALMVPPVLWILVLLLRRAREKLVDARLLLVPVFLVYGNFLVGGFIFATFQLGWQHRYAIETFPVLSRPFSLNSDVLANFIFLVAMVAILVNRFTRTRREEERYAGEFEAARSVQALLVAATAPRTPGFTVESVYIPASEVGGDFFQIFPSDDGSLLIVVGDVSGKGLKAAMTVSTIVGALRDHPARKPVEILAHLNRVLYGQVSGFVTCAAALIAADGAMTLANAGNPAPYLNGKELAVDSGLPLGILAEGNYTETHYEIAAGDRLTFVSDGVVESTNGNRELFGFDRTQAISNQPADKIAETARHFGQEDDISVLSVVRVAGSNSTA